MAAVIPIARPSMPDKKLSHLLPDSKTFRLEEFPFYWLAQTYAIYEGEIERVLKRLGTDLPTRRVLMMLGLFGKVSVSELAGHSITKLSTTTRIIQRMRDEGLVETSVNEDDARITNVEMTQKGIDLLESIHQGTHKIYLRAYQDLGRDELQKMTNTLKRIHGNLAGL